MLFFLATSGTSDEGMDIIVSSILAYVSTLNHVMGFKNEMRSQEISSSVIRRSQSNHRRSNRLPLARFSSNESAIEENSTTISTLNLWKPGTTYGCVPML
ncbi:hypothetical protein NE237_001346 [Protea cynaroides]|uniref:Uncharacterized protein n=1 Tax=Protea cynaroides TaxID=273540 RepID=A0A9Q0QXZ8_9MAGN|nr:hypothetical protein NE237_001346 [Protea cynaroides]